MSSAVGGVVSPSLETSQRSNPMPAKLALSCGLDIEEETGGDIFKFGCPNSTEPAVFSHRGKSFEYGAARPSVAPCGSDPIVSNRLSASCNNSQGSGEAPSLFFCVSCED